MTIFVIVGVVIIYSFLPRILSNFPSAELGGAVFADVTSANVVGYMDKSFNKNTWSMTANTFLPCGGGSMKLGNIIPKANGSGTLTKSSFYIQMLHTDGNPMFLRDDARLNEFANGLTVKGKWPDQVVEFVWVPNKNAWFIKKDANTMPTGSKYPMTDYTIPAGAGFLVNIADDEGVAEGVSFTYSGEVDKIGQDVAVPNNTWQITANIAPCDMKLSEFTITANEGSSITKSNFYIQMVHTDGNPMFLRDDTRLDAFANGLTVKGKWPDQVVEFVWVPNKNDWFIKKDANTMPTGSKYPMSDYTIPAGAGFLIRSESIGENGAKFTLPACSVNN